MSKKLSLITILILTLFNISANAADINQLSLTEYLDSIKKQNFNYLASQEQYLASDLLQKQSDMLTSPTLFGELKDGFTKQDNNTLSASNYTLNSRNYLIGISHTSNLGIETKLSYDLQKYLYRGSNVNSSPANSSGYRATPKIELTIPLWQGFNGKIVKSKKENLFYNNESQKLASLQTSLQELVDGQKAYWQLATARKIVAIQKSQLKSAKEILDYTTKRRKMNLMDESDLLQARASYLTKESELKMAQNNEILAALNFNQHRHKEGSAVYEKLEDINYNELQEIKLYIPSSISRYDVKKAEADMKSAIANADLTTENNKPSLNVVSQYSFNSFEKNFPNTVDRSLEDRGKDRMVGLIFTIPLNSKMQNEIINGSKLSASSARIKYHQTLFEQQNDWKILLQNLTYQKENLKLAREIEKAQRFKLQNAKKLLKEGRATTYEILVFEQDYNHAQIETIKYAYEILNLLADYKLYIN